MKMSFRYLLLVFLAFFVADVMMSQTIKWKEIRKVKRKETIYGIAKENGITEEELRNANP
ncbi:MAG: LysM peptidoglycan-binding domain-containing protein, partial [Prevotella sp.]